MQTYVRAGSLYTAVGSSLVTGVNHISWESWKLYPKYTEATWSLMEPNEFFIVKVKLSKMPFPCDGDTCIISKSSDYFATTIWLQSHYMFNDPWLSSSAMTLNFIHSQFTSLSLSFYKCIHIMIRITKTFSLVYQRKPVVYPSTSPMPCHLMGTTSFHCSTSPFHGTQSLVYQLMSTLIPLLLL